MDNTDAIIAYYDTQVEIEWQRIDGRPEFILTCHYLDRYIASCDTVLDIGGGPGRYATYLAGQGCDVTLLDLSPANVQFAKAKAKELRLPLQALQGDARTADTAVQGLYDHVLLMGPLYHLQTEQDRKQAVEASLRLLKPGGMLFVSFISLYAPLIYAMKYEPEYVIEQNEPSLAYMHAVEQNKSFAGHLFTHAFFINPTDILPFMAQFPLERRHLFAQEGVTAPGEPNIMAQPQEVIDKWLALSEILAERQELLTMAEHIMYIGQKK